VDPSGRVGGTQDRKRRILEMRLRETQHVVHGRQQGRACGSKGSWRPGLDPYGPVCGDVVPRGTRLGDWPGCERRLIHRQRSKEVGAHSVLPGQSCRRLDRATEQAPARIGVRPEPGSWFSLRDLRREPRQDVVHLALRFRELELRAQRDPRAIGEKVTHGGALPPTRVAQFRHVLCDRIVQGETASRGEPSNNRRDHRLGQRPDGEASIRRHRLARRGVGDSDVGGAHCPLAEETDRRPWYGVSGRVLAEQAR
jgi:hypothetical protein